ncbi:hypothetical protein OF820_12610 [Oceanotoga sp. DSM 15011]|uniref:ABC-2 type transport system permease protein n=1 Tax=Oceanotoga teriensis TaxID=515440 RepID=A0AA45C8I5_9BACT|nr:MULTISPECIES: hypothetical protein [Oceanotoga]MDO7975615.1 hypothetical protein [Oceanotoga teriensis]PWJ96096.1 ABC-2 type transport system permease protein [Oceanotoga teriensis]UYO99878.1 hypothetical protein OF820_12610 [Oceanotoga sp. DSM 15011]
MSDILYILKYSLKSKIRPRKNKKGEYKKQGVTGTLLSYLLPPIIFGIIIAPLFYITFKDLNIPLSTLGINIDYTFTDLIYSMTFMSLSLLFIINFAPAIIINLFGSEFTSVLLTMPIKRTSIFYSYAIDSLLMAGMPIGLFIPMVITYSMISKVNIFMAIISMIFYILLLLSISFLIGIFMSKIMGKTTANRVYMMTYFLGIFLFVFASNFFSPQKFNTENIQQIAQNFENAGNFFLNNLWPHKLFIDSMYGNIIPFGIIVFLSIILIYINYKIINSSELISKSKKSKKQQNIKIKNIKNPFLRKDTKFLMRDSQSLFLILYPIILPIIFFFTGQQIFEIITMVFIFIASYYAAFLNVSLLVEEGKIWPLPKLYPIDTQKLIEFKARVPIIIFSLEYILVTIMSFFVLKISLIYLFLIIPVIILIYYSTILGTRLYVENPKRDMKNKNVLTGREVLKIETITMTLSAGIFIPIFMYKLYTMNPFWIFKNMPDILNKFLLIGIPIIIMIINVFMIISEKRKIKTNMINWE